MSEVNQVAGQATTAATVSQNDAAEALKKMQERFSKRGKILSLANDTVSRAAFAAIVSTLSVTGKDANGADISNPHFVDWTDKAPETFTNYALVKVDTEDKDGSPTEHAGDMRLISIADQVTALADPTVAAALYRLYVGRVINLATDDEAQEANFIVANGAFKVSFAEEAFDAVAKELLKVLHKQGVAGITKSSLKSAFSNAAFASSMFPRIKAEYWEKIIGIAKAFAASKGLDVSLYDYWLTTRSAIETGAKDIDLDLSALEAAVSGVTLNAEAQAANQAAIQPATGAA